MFHQDLNIVGPKAIMDFSRENFPMENLVRATKKKIGHISGKVFIS